MTREMLATFWADYHTRRYGLHFRGSSFEMSFCEMAIKYGVYGEGVREIGTMAVGTINPYSRWLTGVVSKLD